MPRQPDFFKGLEREQVEQLEAYARTPGVTIDDCVAWLASNVGKTVKRNAVWRWKRRFDMEDRTSAAADLADAMFTAAKESGGVAVPDAAIMQIATMVFEHSASLDAEKASTKDLANLALAMQRLTLGKQRVEDVRAEMQKRQREAVDEAAKVAASGGNASSVVDKVREILGVK
jgi:uncharacterized metal-binding protein